MLGKKRHDTSINVIVHSYFKEKAAYLISGNIKIDSIERAHLIITVTGPSGFETIMTVKAEADGNFGTEVIASVKGRYLICVQYFGRIIEFPSETRLTIGVIEASK